MCVSYIFLLLWKVQDFPNFFVLKYHNKINAAIYAIFNIIYSDFVVSFAVSVIKQFSFFILTKEISKKTCYLYTF